MFDITKKQIPNWTITKSGVITLSSTHEGYLSIRRPTPDGHNYLTTGLTKRRLFDSPPISKKDYTIDPATDYIVNIETEILGHMSVRFWMMEYDDESRLKYSKQQLYNGVNAFTVTTGDQAQYFRIAFRLSGEGELVFKDIRMFRVAARRSPAELEAQLTSDKHRGM
jgi:hypothetical protein